MRHVLLYVCCIFCIADVIAQNVPQGMKYQAVARDNTGQIIADTQIDLKVSLHGDLTTDQTYYIEEHSVTTNKLGLFTLTIGEGRVMTGDFVQIPWNKEGISMRVAIMRDNDERFTVISESRLLSVPYAFHAATASRLSEKPASILSDTDSDGDDRIPDPGSDSNNWHTDGNLNTQPTTDFLGTADSVDLVIITNYIERMRVLKDGDINVINSMDIGENLDVEDNVDLNTGLTGETRNFGPFTVMEQSPTLLSGELTVDLATDLNLSLNVDGQTTLQSSLDVLNQSPTHLTGTLLTDGIATFSNTTQSTDRSNGAVILKGGMGIDSNLNVGGDLDVRGSAAFGGPVDFESVVTIRDETQSTNTGNGALIVFGGVGIGKNLNVGQNTSLTGTLGVGGATALNSTLTVTGATALNNTLDVAGATTINGATQINNTLTVGPHATSLGGTLGVTGAASFASTVDVSGVTHITNPTGSTSTSTGALKVTGGVGIGENLYMGGNLNIAGRFDLITNGGTGHVAKFENTADGNGILVKLGAATPHNNNNFMTFQNSGGTVVGRIEGENGSTDLANNREYQDELTFKDIDIALSGTGLAIAIAEEIQAIVDLTAATASTTVCIGLGACVTAPIASFIVGNTANLILQTANLILQSADLATVIAAKVTFVNTHQAEIGVTFASGAGDYAEYLPKLDMNEVFISGDVVGMKNGYITKNTSNADRIMVISFKPAVLGAMPVDTDPADYEIVAFMGQVPTRIMGPAEPGDYILPSGFHNGFGIARNPRDMKPDDYKKVLGIAWERAEGIQMNMVNVAVGLNTNDLADVVAAQDEKIQDQNEEIQNLQQQIRETHAILGQLVPGFKEAADIEFEMIASSGGGERQHQDQLQSMSEPGYEPHPHDRASESDIIYYEVTDEELEAGFAMAEEVCIKHGMDLSKHPFWNRIKSDPGYKDEVKQDLRSKLKHVMHTHKKVNRELGN